MTIDEKLDLIIELLTKPQKANKPKEYVPDQAFLTWWEKYPRKVNKKGALRTWMANDLSSISEKIMSGLEKDLKMWRNKEIKFVPHPLTWLNQDRWETEEVWHVNPLTEHEIVKIARR